MHKEVQIYPTGCHHGESPVWDGRYSRLFLVDIVVGCVLSVDSFGSIERLFEGASLTSVCLAEPDCLVVCNSGALSIGGSHFESILPEGRGDVRLNEAKVDSKGRMWVASMDRAESRPVGSLYRISPCRGRSTIMTGLTVGNGIDWSTDDRRMYLTDSGVGCIYCFDFDPLRGTIANRRVFASIPRRRGVPDGLTVDCEDGVWSAHFDGGQLTRYLPTGEIDFIWDLPAKSPTSLCFGGPNRSFLFVTTSTLGGSVSREYDGAVLRIPTRFSGLTSNRFRCESAS